MRSVTFARIAAQAELLRLRHLVRRQAMRVVFAVVAAIFLLAALIGLHVACALLLAEYLSPVQASLIVAGVDLVLAIVLAVLAARDVPGTVEREALVVRRQAVTEAIESMVLATLLSRLVRVRSFRGLLGVLGSAFAAWFAGRQR